MKRKHLLYIPVVLFLAFTIVIAGIAHHIKGTVRDIFSLNQLRKSEGYYLAEFEWKMIASANYLDTGHYVRALILLQTIHDDLSNPLSLARAPVTTDDREMLAFYKDLQNPATGAFMRDDSLPLFTYIGPTANMIPLIADLSAKAGKQFELKYPLSFLDRINTPDRLRALLDEASRVGWIGSKFKTPYVCVAELGELATICERLGVYQFSTQWRTALLDWFFENQDPDSGLWGPRSRSDGRLLRGGSLTESERVIKMFLDREGNQIHPAYPLRYADKIVASALAKLVTPMPDDLDQLHEWILARDHGTRFITRYLWSFASLETKKVVKSLMEDFIQLRFRTYYVEEEGAFSLYPDSDTADLDGTGEAIGMYGYLGILDSHKQQRLWGDYETIVEDFGQRTITEISMASFRPISRFPGINSIRVYAESPGGRFLEGVSLIYYPTTTPVPDAVRLLANVENWLDRTTQQMGNWVTKDSIRKSLAHVTIQPVRTFTQPPVEEANGVLKNNGRLVLVGFDLLQVPRCMMTYRFREQTPGGESPADQISRLKR